MELSTLLQKLGTVAPALSSDDIVPVCKDFWFTGKQLLAYNGEISISVPCDLGLSGSLSELLRKTLSSSTASEVTVSVDQERVALFKFGNSRLRLGLGDTEAFKSVFSMPAAPKPTPQAEALCFAVREGVAVCELSLPDKPEIHDPALRGVTIIPDGDVLRMFSSDSATISCTTVKCKGHGIKERIIVPAKFCKLLLSAPEGVKSYLYFNKSSAFLVRDDGIRIFGRLVEGGKPVDFASIVKSRVPPLNTFVPILGADGEEGLKEMLTRSIAVIDSAMEKDKARMTIRARKGFLEFETQSEIGRIMDRFSVENHKDVEVRFNPRLLVDAVKNFDTMIVTERCVCLASGNNIFIAAITE